MCNFSNEINNLPATSRYPNRVPGASNKTSGKSDLVILKIPLKLKALQEQIAIVC